MPFTTLTGTFIAYICVHLHTYILILVRPMHYGARAMCCTSNFLTSPSGRHDFRVRALILRGIFMCRRSELLFFYQDGASHIFPDKFAPYRDHIPKEEQGDLIKAYYKRLTSEDGDIR